MLPAVYAPSSLYPPTITNKIDLSASVTQFMRTSSNQLNKSDHEQSDDERCETICRSPSAQKQVNDAIKTNSNFEYFTRQITETNPPVPLALDSYEYDSSGSDSIQGGTIASPPQPTAFGATQRKLQRKSIYEMSDSDDENDDNSNSVSLRRLSEDDGDSSQQFSTTKDKDMRISSIFIDKDYSNGDIDLRLPFKPVMANYIPATEIDASITSHAPIVYSVSHYFSFAF